jgi:hypothetical protein
MKGMFFPGQEQKTRNHFCCVLTLALLLIAPAAVFGQAYFGSVTGVLTDQTGAVIPGAKVTLTDQDKGYSFNATSEINGRYLFRSVPPGFYSVTATVPGFEKTVRTGIHVDVNQNATANMSLKVSSASQTVEVKSQGQGLDVQDATTGLVVDRKFINDLPLVDRYIMDLVSLTPGVTEADDQCSTGCTGTNFISNGSRNSTADVLMDGATITNYEPNGGVTNVTYTPSSEAVDEFRVEQSNFSAEYGFSGASIVNMITRSGSNTFHGEAYDFVRNTITDANNWFNDLNGIPIPPVHRHNFGGIFSGPIHKKKTFFFFDYDATRQSSMGTYQAGVPTDAERQNGDFGEVCTTQGGTFDGTGLCSVAAGQIWDPYSSVYQATPPNGGGAGAYRQTFIPYNNIGTYISPGNTKLIGTPYQLPGGPGNLIDPVAKQLMNLFPEPTANMANPTIYDNWIASGASRNPNDQFDIKIDQRFNDKNLMSAKYSQQWASSDPFNCFGNFADPCAGGPNQTTAHLFTLTDAHTFSQTLLLTATLGFTRGAENILAYNGAGGVTDPVAKLNMPEYLNSNGFQGVPSMFIDQGTYYSAGYTSIGGDPYGNYKQGQDTGQLTIAVNKVLGNHEMKFGFEGRQHQMNYIQTNAPNGIFNFDHYGTAQCPNDYATCGGDGMATFMMGYQDGGTYYEIQDRPATEDHQYAVFGQDNWKVNRKLTLNLGLRYDVSRPRTDRFNRQNWLDLTAPFPVSVPGLAPLTGGEFFASSQVRHIVNNDWKDIQPRFGFAYLLDPKTVVRGGYGIYYSQPRSGATGVAPYGAQGFNQYTNAIETYNNDGATPYLHLSDPFPNGLIPAPGSSLGIMNDYGYGANGPLRNVTTTPYEQSWSFGLEMQLPWNIVTNMVYVGKKGTHLYYSGDNYINHLGPSVEGASRADLNNLTTMVNNPFYGINTDPNSILSSPQIPELNLQLPWPQFPGGVTIEPPPIANSEYHAMQLTAEKRYTNGLQFLASFVWSKSIDDASAPDDNTTWLGSFSSLVDPNKPWLERSLSTFDIPFVYQFTYTYDLPVGRGKALLGQMPVVLDAIIGGWKTNGVWRISYGRPLPFFTYDGTSLPTYGGQRPNIVGTLKRTKGKDSNWINNYIANPQDLQLPPEYAFGSAPRATGMVRSPTAFNTNMSVEKEFALSKLRDGMSFELRLEAENALNHPVFGTPDTSVDDPNFGVIGYTSNGPRQMQLGGKLNF